MRKWHALVGYAVLVFGCSGPSGPSSPLDFEGQYAGTYRIVSCSASPPVSIDDPCGYIGRAGFSVGATLPIELSLAQNQNAVTGTVKLGLQSGNFQGSVQPAGNLIGTGTLGPLVIDRSYQGLNSFTFNASWNATLAHSGTMLTGSFNLMFKDPSTTGGATLVATLLQVSRR